MIWDAISNLYDATLMWIESHDLGIIVHWNLSKNINSQNGLKPHILTSWNGNIFRVTGHLCGELNGYRWIPRTKANDTFFDLCLNKRLSKQPWGWWFVTPSRPLWRHCNEVVFHQENNSKEYEYINHGVPQHPITWQQRNKIQRNKIIRI